MKRYIIGEGAKRQVVEVPETGAEAAGAELTANKNQAGGYAGLGATSKVAASQISEVLALADLTDSIVGAWQASGLATGFSQFSGFETVRHRKITLAGVEIIVCQGLAKNTSGFGINPSGSQVVLTLAAGHRPATPLLRNSMTTESTAGATAQVRLTINAAGEVIFEAGPALADLSWINVAFAFVI